MTIHKPRRLAIAGIAGVAFAIAGAVSVTSAGSQEAAFGHFWVCLGHMITAPDVHANECLPGRIGPGLTSLSTPVSNGGPPGTVVPSGGPPPSPS